MHSNKPLLFRKLGALRHAKEKTNNDYVDESFLYMKDMTN